MNDPLQPARCARMLAALAAPERLRIIRSLQDGPRNVGEIAEFLKVSVVNTSHHLTVLRNAGLVQCERHGRFMVYSLPPGVFHSEEGKISSADHLNLGCCRLEMPKAEE